MLTWSSISRLSGDLFSMHLAQPKMWVVSGNRYRMEKSLGGTPQNPAVGSHGFTSLSTSFITLSTILFIFSINGRQEMEIGLPWGGAFALRVVIISVSGSRSLRT